MICLFAGVGRMKRGTTPIHEFDVDLDLTAAEVVYVTYVQGNKRILEKDLQDLTITPTQISCRLTQEETLDFRTGVPVEMQIRCRFPDGSAFETDIMITDVDRLLKEGVI